MKIRLFTQFGLLLLIGLASCDKIDDPIPKEIGTEIVYNGTTYIVDPILEVGNTQGLLSLIDNTTWTEVIGPDNSSQRFIVLEEFTGHKCLNCPIGTREVVRLDDKFGDQLIPIAIHAGDFAKPLVNETKYTTDHRPAGGHGETYSKTFNPGDAYPRGMVSRIGGIVSTVNSWEGNINAIKDDAPIAKIDLKNYYSESSNLLRIDIALEWLQSNAKIYNLQVMVVEDHIIDWQLDISVDVENYDHRHVLRKIVNDTWGKSLNATVQGEAQKIQYILPLDPSWKSVDLESVVFIFDNTGTSEIIQANAAHVKE